LRRRPRGHDDGDGRLGGVVYRQIPFVHVEAGLRTGNLQALGPKNSIDASPASWRRPLAHPRNGADALLAEKTDPKTVHVTGNTVIDALLWATERERAGGERWHDKYASWRPTHMLITGTSAELRAGFEAICGGIATMADRFPMSSSFTPCI
jgi:UDP-N-acetylglucosamine 2-epimerase (non-hydrolysing)